MRITSGGGQNIFIAPDTGVGLIVGVTTEDIPNNSSGRVTTFGTLHDLNTAAFNDGDQLFSSSAGALTTSLVIVRRCRHGVARVSGTIHASPDRRVVGNGTTAQRPTARVVGFTYMDSTLGIPVFWNGRRVGQRVRRGGVMAEFSSAFSTAFEVAAVEPSPGPSPGPGLITCGDICGSSRTSVTTAALWTSTRRGPAVLRDIAMRWAARLLWTATGRQFGGCPEDVPAVAGECPPGDELLRRVRGDPPSRRSRGVSPGRTTG